MRRVRHERRGTSGGASKTGVLKWVWEGGRAEKGSTRRTHVLVGCGIGSHNAIFCSVFVESIWEIDAAPARRRSYELLDLRCPEVLEQEYLV